MNNKYTKKNTDLSIVPLKNNTLTHNFFDCLFCELGIQDGENFGNTNTYTRTSSGVKRANLFIRYLFSLINN